VLVPLEVLPQAVLTVHAVREFQISATSTTLWGDEKAHATNYPAAECFNIVFVALSYKNVFHAINSHVSCLSVVPIFQPNVPGRQLPMSLRLVCEEPMLAMQLQYVGLRQVRAATKYPLAEAVRAARDDGVRNG
jgi:hypothetical protein